jgi:type IV pilus assembly protein PilV
MNRPHAPGRPHAAARSERGGFLLEALVGILIFTLGVIGLFALQARAIGYTSDVQYRGQAAYLANAYLSKMWAMPRATLTTLFDNAGEAEYDAFQAAILVGPRRLPGADDPALAPNPLVTITQPPAGGLPNAGGNISLTDNSTLVTITILWQQSAAEGAPPTTHQYTITSILGIN